MIIIEQMVMNTVNGKFYLTAAKVNIYPVKISMAGQLFSEGMFPNVIGKILSTLNFP